MRRNTVAINNVFLKNYKTKFSISSILKKIKLTKIILKNHVGKHRSNPQYFKGKKLQSEIFNQLNIKKVKSKKIIKKNKQKKEENLEKKGK